MRKFLLKAAAIAFGAAVIAGSFSMGGVYARTIETTHWDEEAEETVVDWEYVYDDDGKAYLENTTTHERLSGGWHKVNGLDVYFNEDGSKCRDEIHDGKINGYMSAYDGEDWITYTSPFTLGSDAKGSFYADAKGNKLRANKDDSENKKGYRVFRVDGKKLVVDVDGYLVTNKWVDEGYETDEGWRSIWEYAEENGFLAEGWKKIDDKWYFFSDEFSVANSVTDINGRKEGTDPEFYAFDENGALIEESGWYSESTGDYTRWYYIEDGGKAVTGWKQIDGDWYFFDYNYAFMVSGGAAATNADGSGDYYIFEKDGKLSTGGWVDVSFDEAGQHFSNWFYANSDGTAVSGWKQIDGYWYYFAESGYMRSEGWQDGYYLGADGALVDGITGAWYQDDKGWYFMDNTGWFAKDTWYIIDNVYYEFDADGYMSFDGNATAG